MLPGCMLLGCRAEVSASARLPVSLTTTYAYAYPCVSLGGVALVTLQTFFPLLLLLVAGIYHCRPTDINRTSEATMYNLQSLFSPSDEILDRTLIYTHTNSYALPWLIREKADVSFEMPLCCLLR